MRTNRRDRGVSLGLEGLEGRKLLSTVTLAPRQGAHIDVMVTPGIQGQHIGMTAGIVGQHIGMTAGVVGVTPHIQGQHIG